MIRGPGGRILERQSSRIIIPDSSHGAALAIQPEEYARMLCAWNLPSGIDSGGRKLIHKS